MEVTQQERRDRLAPDAKARSLCQATRESFVVHGCVQFRTFWQWVGENQGTVRAGDASTTQCRPGVGDPRDTGYIIKRPVNRVAAITPVEAGEPVRTVPGNRDIQAFQSLECCTDVKQ